MRGITLNKSVEYIGASFRYFDVGEHHITRTCPEDVLLMVFDGVLRFSENGKDYEVYPGEYHIQKHGSFQAGEIASDSPKYLFVHFYAEWGEACENDGAELNGAGANNGIDGAGEGSRNGGSILPFRGEFSYSKLEAAMKRLDFMGHNDYTQVEQAAVFFEILSLLYRKEKEDTLANRIAGFIEENYEENLSLEMLSEEFHFSKNHIINIFRKEYGVTPFEYVKNVRIKKAEWLLEVTPKTAESIALECGFRDYSYFYKVFRDKNLLSPKEWRKRKRMNPYG
ncbi:MAG: helix-turn-helix transcriptional regulator [Roseburia sp.]|nr:helix-turn-helix transcriptional regulator [Roseburia sp.]